MKQRITFLGLGNMGYPMAGHLSTKGYDVTIYNRTSSKCDQWLTEFSGSKALTPKEAVNNADIVFTCLGNDSDVLSIYQSDEGIFSGIKPSTILIDNTTTSAQLAETLYKEAKSKNADFLDAPVSGGEIGAVNGQLTTMVGGDELIFNKAYDALMSFSKASSYIGSNGSGQRIKMVNQICIGGILQGLSEAITFAKATGISAEKVVETLQHGAAGSWQMIAHSINMEKQTFNHGFKIDWMRKDLGICLDAAKELNVKLPNVEYVDNAYKQLQTRGFQNSDTCSLIMQFNEKVNKGS